VVRYKIIVSAAFFLLHAHAAVVDEKVKPVSWGQKAGDLVYDFFMINRHFFSRDTLKIMAGFTPLYIGTRFADHKVHSWHYDHATHTNVRQPHRYCDHILEVQGGVIPFAVLTSFMFFSKDEHLRMTSRIYALGAISVFLAKKIIKNTIELDCTERPYNENFPKKRVQGGFPSGHAFIFTYSAVYWGLEYGIKAFVPLALYGVAGTWLLVNCNRHYASQVVAGVALGGAYALAAHKVSSAKWAKDLEVSVGRDKVGRPAVGLTYAF
jgi:membrane-associated phospholipid phosphatase